ncbi:MAG: alpha/beta fold hydrolase [Desulfomonile sp.]|nr:alpha/beta fold hydrolase [Desulfomonile sp.]
MPLLDNSTYRPPLFLSNPHIQTILPSLFRKVRGVAYTRERIDTPDGDFIDLDWSRVGASRVAIVLHGLEGNSQRSYVLGMVKALNRMGWDAIALNFRGCSGEINRSARFYHSGDTEDLDRVISHVASFTVYREAALVGFSLGGNVVLKYLGERGQYAHSLIKGAVAFSVPCDLTAGALKIGSPGNKLYMRRFLKMLGEKIRLKAAMMPELISDRGFEQIKDFKQFDDRYTAPLHGFASAEDYWRRASSKPFLERISVPTLLVNAADDPFLAPECYPKAEAERSSSFFLEVPRFGGHVGFMAFNRQREYWSEARAAAFLNEQVSLLS